MIYIDSEFTIKPGGKNGNADREILIGNKSRKLRVRAADLFEAAVWLNRLRKVSESSPWGPSGGSFENESFAPIREYNTVQYFVDGEQYFRALYEALHLAEKQVFITDWWLTPEYYLQRPVDFDNQEMEKYRLDNVLAELANDGVKIFIIVYKEVEFAGLYHNSAHTKHTLQSRNPEYIKVLRHPRSFVSLWSHHEKI